MVLRSWVPLTHSLWARNWNLAASGACFTASRVANRVVVSTPLRIESLTSLAVMSVVVILVHLLVGGGAQLLLELDERRHRRIGRQAAGDLEDLPYGLVALPLIGRERRGLL